MPVWGTGSHPASCCADINCRTERRNKWVGAEVTSTRESVVVHDHRLPQADSARLSVVKSQLPKEQSNRAANCPHPQRISLRNLSSLASRRVKLQETSQKMLVGWIQSNCYVTVTFSEVLYPPPKSQATTFLLVSSIINQKYNIGSILLLHYHVDSSQ